MIDAIARDDLYQLARACRNQADYFESRRQFVRATHYTARRRVLVRIGNGESPALVASSEIERQGEAFKHSIEIALQDARSIILKAADARRLLETVE